MLGVTLLISASRPSSPIRLLVAAALLFVAFMAKYLVAIYFPFVCVSVVLAGWMSSKPRPRLALHNFGWFVVPLSVACAAYAFIFLSPLLTLLSSSLHYGDLRSPDPLREYVWTRPELGLLVAAAVVGWRQTRWDRRLLAAGGAAIIMAFQFAAHPDFDLRPSNEILSGAARRPGLVGGASEHRDVAGARHGGWQSGGRFHLVADDSTSRPVD
jgi:hypothetical protein